VADDFSGERMLYDDAPFEPPSNTAPDGIAVPPAEISMDCLRREVELFCRPGQSGSAMTSKQSAVILRKR
jgi:hypothetical protein